MSIRSLAMASDPNLLRISTIHNATWRRHGAHDSTKFSFLNDSMLPKRKWTTESALLVSELASEEFRYLLGNKMPMRPVHRSRRKLADVLRHLPAPAKNKSNV
jgi:hypothetical protein